MTLALIHPVYGDFPNGLRYYHVHIVNLGRQ